MDKGRKLEESLGLEGLYMMREKEDRRENISLGEKIKRAYK